MLYLRNNVITMRILFASTIHPIDRIIYVYSNESKSDNNNYYCNPYTHDRHRVI